MYSGSTNNSHEDFYNNPLADRARENERRYSQCASTARKIKRTIAELEHDICSAQYTLTELHRELEKLTHEFEEIEKQDCIKSTLFL